MVPAVGKGYDSCPGYSSIYVSNLDDCFVTGNVCGNELFCSYAKANVWGFIIYGCTKWPSVCTPGPSGTEFYEVYEYLPPHVC